MRRPIGRLRAWSPLDVALLALTVALVAGAAARLALARPEALVLDARAEPSPALGVAPVARAPTAPEELALAVATDPFAPDRSPPPMRYRPPEAARGRPLDPERSRERALPEYRLRGVGLRGRAALALIEGSPSLPGPRLYREGESLDDFRVRRIAADSVVLERPDTMIVLRITRPWNPSAP